MATLGSARGVTSTAGAAQRARSSGARGVVNGSHDEAEAEAEEGKGVNGEEKVEGWRRKGR
jgi:hypothetical protein